MIPKEVETLDSLPKTSSGKVNYPMLREREARQHATVV
jgi:acyl-coenzyme A synthetase/AMP-(fatty) acid ligase